MQATGLREKVVKGTQKVKVMLKSETMEYLPSNLVDLQKVHNLHRRKKHSQEVKSLRY